MIEFSKTNHGAKQKMMSHFHKDLLLNRSRMWNFSSFCQSPFVNYAFNRCYADAAQEKLATDANWETAHQWSNQEKIDFLIFPIFVILTSLSAKFLQSYVREIYFPAYTAN